MGREENGVAPPQRRFRGKYRQPAWRRSEGQPVAVMVLELPVTDPRTLRRLANLYAAAWHIKRAVQRDARARVDAYWAARTQRKDKGPKAVRERLGLSREGLQRAAYQHLEDSGWLRHHLTKALAMHLTGEVWTATQRHLFGDATGKRAGRPKAGRWWDFTRIPGRARSHTTAAKWETFRLVGTLEGHVGAFRHPHLPQDVHPHTPADAAQLPPGQSVLLQPRRMPTPTVPTGHVPTGNPTPSGRRKATWWDYDGPLAVVLTGIGGGDLVLPVRLPQGCGCWPRVLHFLADPDAWHKIDLVRRRKPSAPGGWAYEAHLMVLRPGYAAPGTVELRRQAAKLDRVAGVDGNVSHLEVVSLPATLDPAAGPVLSSEITLSEADKRRLLTQASKRRRRQRALDRSRRATNAQQYGLSKRQKKRAERRQVAGLPGKTVQMPRGPRAARNNGPPSRAYRTDRLSKSYQHHRDRLAANAARAAQANKARAMLLARHLIGIHGSNLTIEDCDIRAWFRLWGKRLSQTTPACSSMHWRRSAPLPEGGCCGRPRSPRRCRSTAFAAPRSASTYGIGNTSAPPAASPASGTWSQPHSASSFIWMTPMTRPLPAWTTQAPGTHSSCSGLGYKKPCASQPQRTCPWPRPEGAARQPPARNGVGLCSAKRRTPRPDDPG